MTNAAHQTIEAEPLFFQVTSSQRHGSQADQRPGARRSQSPARLEANTHQGAGRHPGLPHAEIGGASEPRRDPTPAVPAPHQHDPGDDGDGQAGQAGRGHRDAEDPPTGSCRSSQSVCCSRLTHVGTSRTSVAHISERGCLDLSCSACVGTVR